MTLLLNLIGAVPHISSRGLFGEGRGPVFLGDLNCTGEESNLLECSYTPFVGEYCRHSRDVAVECQGNTWKETLSCLLPII